VPSTRLTLNDVDTALNFDL